MCDHHLADSPLVCTRTDEHDPTARGGHTYQATVGPDLDNASPTTPKHHARGDEQ